MSIRRARSMSDERGFTIIELTLVVALTAIVFTALAATLAGDLKAIGVQKTRSQANELATQGIEDLQRYDFNNLGVCSGAADPAPSSTPASLTGLTPVQLPNCSSGSLVYSQPCSPPVGTLTTFAVPRQTYTCVRDNVSYGVSRYVLWTDATLTGKRLAVFVTWVDPAGRHEISQQSSLRSPNSASVIGLVPPQFISVTVAASNPILIAADGSIQGSMTFNASTLGLTNVDQVSVTLATLTTQPDGSITALPRQFTLTPGSPCATTGCNWTTTVSPATSPIPQFDSGSQYVVFTEIRASDGKANSKFWPTPARFCPGSGCPNALPTIASATVAPSAVNIDPSGVLQTSFTISAVTTNLTFEALVSAAVQTQTGAAMLQLQPASSCSTGNVCNSWSASITAGSVNLRFLPGSQVFYITAIEPPLSGNPGSSAVGQSNSVSFQ